MQIVFFSSAASMETTLFALALLAAVLLVVWRLRVGGGAAPIPLADAFVGENRGTVDSLDPATRFVELPKAPGVQLLNDAEQILYRRLLEAVPSMLVFAQVGVAQLAQLRGRQDAEQLRSMAGRGVDFIVCRQDFTVIAAIELCWPAPPAVAGQPQGIEAYKRQALERLGIPLIVFRPNRLPDADGISREIAAAIVLRNRLEARRERSSGA